MQLASEIRAGREAAALGDCAARTSGVHVAGTLAASIASSRGPAGAAGAAGAAGRAGAAGVGPAAAASGADSASEINMTVGRIRNLLE
jgi:hypothetical protein